MTKRKGKISVYAFPCHQSKKRTSGVDFARIIQPANELAKNPDFYVEHFDINKETDWLYVAKNFDIIFFNYLQNPWGYAALGAMARKHGTKIVFDIDDSLWNIQTDNEVYKVWKPGEEPLKNFTAICNDVDYITTSNSYLRNVIHHNTYKYHDSIKVLPNYIDLNLYKHRSPFKNTQQIMLMHFGSTTHFYDLYNEKFRKGMDMIMKQYPQVVFKTVGASIGAFKEMWGSRYFNDFGHEDIYHWIKDKDKFPHFMDEADIVVTPLVESLYNKCKSNIKFLEASSAKKPGVWEDMRQYQEVVNGENGLLAHSAQDWYDQIERLIKDVELRRSMGEAAFKTIKDNWTIQKNINQYVDFFKSIV